MKFRVTPDTHLQFLQFLTHRKDAHALQGKDGRYRRINAGIRVADYRRHLKGLMTLGSYQIAEDCVRWAVWDVDNHEGDSVIPEEIVRETLAELHTKLDEQNIPHLLAESSPGSYHVWLLFDPPAPAYKAYHYMREIGGNEIETFPKQEEVTKDGYGNLVRLPLGIHQKKRSRYHYINSSFHPIDEFDVETLDLSEYAPQVQRMKAPAGDVSEDETHGMKAPAVCTPGGIPPCLTHLLQNNIPLTGGNGHYVRISIVCAFRDAGLPFAALCKLFTLQADYDQVETTKQVASVVKKPGGYSYSCKSLREKCSNFVMGLCKDCPRGKRFK